MEVDRGSASSWGRPPDRVFMVRLRRPGASAIVTVGLSQGSAERLADHIAYVIGGSRPAGGEP
ncbi:hypothetical protein K6U06_15385 [Acidiferrimicrobium sp. IK]|uniref:hypothetical protein n=1 Tax=Acidiferrimicrobium sp. IK TaxID=2871700 RepID=UPI0021CB6A9B|nr:hypothetical protein [Acidiferrimicrobium sp. IK]MCU4185751.1 hypothetical protein [Acidiferrimicrobium sp. IK]